VKEEEYQFHKLKVQSQFTIHWSNGSEIGFARMYRCYSCGGISTFKAVVETQACARTLKIEPVSDALLLLTDFFFLYIITS